MEHQGGRYQRRAANPIRDIEQRIDRAAKLPEIKKPELALPASIPTDYEEHCRLMCDLLVLGFQTDVTRVVTFVVANDTAVTVAKEATGRTELVVLRHLARGESNKQIARRLSIAEPTVKIHVQHVLRKLEVVSRVQAAVIGAEHGLS